MEGVNEGTVTFFVGFGFFWGHLVVQARVLLFLLDSCIRCFLFPIFCRIWESGGDSRKLKAGCLATLTCS